MCMEDQIIAKHTHTVVTSRGFLANVQTIVGPPDKNRVAFWVPGNTGYSDVLISFGNPPTAGTGFRIGIVGSYLVMKLGDIGDALLNAIWLQYGAAQTANVIDVSCDLESAWREIKERRK